MSSFAFSHQFSQHWITTPPAIKNAIIQELDDIAKLLHPNSVLSEYKFSVPNLNNHIEEILTQENVRLAKLKAEQAAQQQLEQERLEQERLAHEQAEKAQEEQHRRKQMRLENERLEQIRLEKERLEQLRLSREKQEQAEEALRPKNEQQELVQIAQPTSLNPAPSTLTAVYSVSTNQELTLSNEGELTSSNEPSHLNDLANQKANTHFTNISEPLLPSSLPYEQIKQEIMANLNQQMADYIQESMQIIRDDLRPWLETEVEKQLAARLNPHDS